MRIGGCGSLALDRPARHLGVVLAAFLMIGSTAALGADIGAVTALQVKALKAEVDTQQRIDRLHDDTQQLASDTLVVERELEQLRAYRQQLAKMVGVQQQQIVRIEDQLERREGTETVLLPMLAEMVDTLRRFVELDLPFQLAERRRRVAELADLLDDPGVGLSEKYRRTMNAYLEEAKYGSSLATYRDRLSLDGRERDVELLRVGRIALIYRTPDGKTYGAWVTSSNRWQTLPAEHYSALRDAYRVADRQLAPQLLRLPLPAPEDAS
jgi:hypothetical protein